MRAGRGSCLARRAASTRVALASAVVVLALVCGVRGEVPRVETRSPANGALNVGVGLDALELAYSVDVEAAHGVVTLHLEGAASAAAEVPVPSPAVSISGKVVTLTLPPGGTGTGREGGVLASGARFTVTVPGGTFTAVSGGEASEAVAPSSWRFSTRNLLGCGNAASQRLPAGVEDVQAGAGTVSTYCDPDADGRLGAWTLVGYIDTGANDAFFDGNIEGARGTFKPVERAGGKANLASLDLVRSATSVAITFEDTLPHEQDRGAATNAGIAAFRHSYSFDLQTPSETRLVRQSGTTPESCSAGYRRTRVDCMHGDCSYLRLPVSMYSGKENIVTNYMRSYGVVEVPKVNSGACDWGPDGQWFKSLYLGWSASGGAVQVSGMTYGRGSTRYRLLVESAAMWMYHPAPAISCEAHRRAPLLHNGIIARWPLDQLRANNELQDTGLRGLGAASATTPNVGSGGTWYKGVYFNGNTYYIAPEVPELEGDPAFTIAGWFYYDGNWPSSFAGILHIDLADTTPVINRNLFVAIRAGRLSVGFAWTKVRTVEQLVQRRWYHFAITKSSGTKIETTSIYINGGAVPVELDIHGRGADYDLLNAAPDIIADEMIIGALREGSSSSPSISGWRGFIQDLTIYNRALSAERVADVFNPAVGGGWLLMAEVTSSTATINRDHYANGRGSPGSSVFLNSCSNFGAAGNWVMRVDMGQVRDYFKPKSPSLTYCEVVRSYTQHSWSATEDGPYVTPSHYSNHLGGSASNWPKTRDGRVYLSFWGGQGSWPAGCCHHSSSYYGTGADGASWGRTFSIYVKWLIAPFLPPYVKPSSLVAEWDFMGDAKDRVGNMDLELRNGATIAPTGGLLLDGTGYARSADAPFAISQMTLEVWVTIKDLSQRGGGAMSIDRDSHQFDAIVYGEKVSKEWMSGSNNGVRTQGVDPPPEFETERPIQLVMTIASSGLRTLYRDGIPLGEYFTGVASYQAGVTYALFGCRHEPCLNTRNYMLRAAVIHHARWYNKPLTPWEVAHAHDSTRKMLDDRQLYRVLGDDGSTHMTMCDQSLGGGGWTKFWWYKPNIAWPSGVDDVLGEEFGSCDPEDDYCFARLPAWLKEDGAQLMAEDAVGTRLMWTFDPSHQVAHRVWLAFHDHIETPRGHADANGADALPKWAPQVLAGTMHTTPQDAFMYRTQDGVKSFLLDDDTCSCQSTLEAGATMCGADNNGCAYGCSKGVDNLNGAGCTYATVDKGLSLWFRPKPYSEGAVARVLMVSAAVSVADDAGVARVTIRRQGSDTEDISVQYYTVEHTAEAGVDFTATEGSVVWDAGEDDDVTISVPIIRRSLAKGRVMFSVALRAPWGASIDGASMVTYVSIEADSTFLPGPLTLAATGGTLDRARNVALSGTAYSSSELPGYAYHKTELVNDGRYSNFHSWIANTKEAVVGILFDEPYTIDAVAWGRDNTGQYSDRWQGQYTVQITSFPNPTSSTSDEHWVTVDTVNGAGPLRHLYQFNAAAAATALRIKTSSSSSIICIDELEVYLSRAGATLEAGLVARYAFSSLDVSTTDGTTTISDVSGSERTARVEGSGVSFDSEAALAAAVFGKGGYLEVPSFANYEFESFTVSLMFRRAQGSSGFQGLIGNGYHTTGTFEIRMTDDGRIGGTVILNTHQKGWIFMNHFTTDEWHHAVLRYDGRDASFFLDGEVSTVRLPAGSVQTSSEPLFVGSSVTPRREDFAGRVHDVRVYNRSLTNNEVARMWEGYKTQISLEDLRVWWPLSEGSGTTARDSSGFNMAGELLNGATWAHGALKCDGRDDYVKASVNLGLQGDAEFTLAGWMYWDGDAWNAADYPSFMGIDHSGNNEGLSFTVRAGRPALDFWSTRVRADEALRVRRWYHLAATKVPGTKIDNTVIYVDGVSVAVSLEGTDAAPAINNKPLVVGRLDSTRWFNGLISDVRIYDRALPASRVQAIYFGALALHWHVDEGRGESLADASPGGQAVGRISTAAQNPWERGTYLRFGSDVDGGKPVGDHGVSEVETGVFGTHAFTYCFWVFSSASAWPAEVELGGFRGAVDGGDFRAGTAVTLVSVQGLPAVDFGGFRLRSKTDGMGVGRWHHVCVRRSHGSGSDGVDLRLDGRWVTTVLDNYNSAADTSTVDIASGLFYIGRVAPQNVRRNFVFDGYINEARVWRRAVSDLELTQLTDSELPQHAQDWVLKLNGEGEKARVESFAFGGSLVTIEAWVWCRTPRTYLQTIIEFADDSTEERNHARLSLEDGTGRLQWLVTNDKGADDGSSVVTSRAVVPETQWVHVALTQSGSEAVFYLNGREVGGGPSVSPNVAVRAFIHIGGSQRPAPATLKGMINDVRVWETARTPSEIEANRQSFPVVSSGAASAMKLSLYLSFDRRAAAPGQDGLSELSSDDINTAADAAGRNIEASVTNCAVACIVPFARATKLCGNGVREATEECDDGNSALGDGCSTACKVESGFVCSASDPLSADVCVKGAVATEYGFDAGDASGWQVSLGQAGEFDVGLPYRHMGTGGARIKQSQYGPAGEIVTSATAPTSVNVVAGLQLSWKYLLHSDGSSDGVISVGGGSFREKTSTYAQNLYPGNSASVHSWRRFAVALSDVASGDILQISLKASRSDGTGVGSGGGQLLYTRNCRVGTIEVSQPELNSGDGWVAMQSLKAMAHGTARVQFGAYIATGNDWFSWKVTRADGTTAAQNTYAGGLAPGMSASVHAYRDYLVDVSNVVAGEDLTIWLKASASNGGGVGSGGTQSLFVRHASIVRDAETAQVANEERNQDDGWVAMAELYTPVSGDCVVLYEAFIQAGNDYFNAQIRSIVPASGRSSPLAIVLEDANSEESADLTSCVEDACTGARTYTLCFNEVSVLSCDDSVQVPLLNWRQHTLDVSDVFRRKYGLAGFPAPKAAFKQVVDITDSNIYIYASTYASGVGSRGDANWIDRCDLYPQRGNWVMLVKMGMVTDYFMPKNDNLNYCDVIKSYTNAIWSPTEDGPFITFDYYSNHLGGSRNLWPSSRDGRRYLSFWGGQGNWQAGCCHARSNAADEGGAVDIASWGQTFSIFYKTLGTVDAYDSPVPTKVNLHLMAVGSNALTSAFVDDIRFYTVERTQAACDRIEPASLGVGDIVAPSSLTINYVEFETDANFHRIQRSPFPFPQDEVTFTCWVWTQRTETFGLISYATSSADNEYLMYQSEGQIIAHVKGATLGTGIRVATGRWEHAAVTWRHSDGALVAYQNGKQVGAGTLSAGGRSIAQGGCFVLAQEQDAVCGGFDLGQAFRGRIAQVALWSMVLSAPDVRSVLYTPPAASSSGLVLLYLSTTTSDATGLATWVDETTNNLDGSAVHGDTMRPRWEPDPVIECADCGALGTEVNPARSCAAISRDIPDASSGTYYIRIRGRVLKTYCDLESDDGGWTLVGVGMWASRSEGWNSNDAVNEGDAGALDDEHWHYSSMDVNYIGGGDAQFRATCFGVNGAPSAYWWGVSNYRWNTYAEVNQRTSCNCHSTYTRLDSCKNSGDGSTSSMFGLQCGTDSDSVVTSVSGNSWKCGSLQANLQVWVRGLDRRPQIEYAENAHKVTGQASVGGVVWPASEFTYSVWFRMVATDFAPLALYSTSVGQCSVMLGRWSDASWRVVIGEQSATLLTRNWLDWDLNWHHYAFSWRASDGTWSLRIDGAVWGSGSGVLTGGTIPQPGVFTLFRGPTNNCGGGGNSVHYEGALGAPSVWATMLDATQVRQVWLAELGQTASPSPSLVLSWPRIGFGPAREAVSWPDVSGNGYHGVFESTKAGDPSPVPYAPGGTAELPSNGIIGVHSCGLDTNPRPGDLVRLYVNGRLQWTNGQFPRGNPRGLNLWLFDKYDIASGPWFWSRYDTLGDSSGGVAAAFRDKINSVPDGTIIAVGCADECSGHIGVARDALTALGSVEAAALGWRHSFSFVTEKGGRPGSDLVKEARLHGRCVVAEKAFVSFASLQYRGTEFASNQPGMSLLFVDEESGAVVDTATVDLRNPSGDLPDLIDGLDDGTFVAGALQGVGTDALFERDVDALATIGVTPPQRVGRGSSWAFLGRKSAPVGSAMSQALTSFPELGDPASASGPVACQRLSLSVPSNAAVGAMVGNLPPIAEEAALPSHYEVVQVDSCGEKLDAFAADPVTGQLVVAGGGVSSLCTSHTVLLSSTSGGFDSGWRLMRAQSAATQGSFLEVAVSHSLAAPEQNVVDVLLKARDGANKGYIFRAAGAPNGRDDDASGFYGGVQFGYNAVARAVRLWAPSSSGGTALGRGIVVTEAFGDGVHSQESSDVDVRVSMSSSGVAPAFDSGWFKLSSRAGDDSFAEIGHGLGVLPGRVKVLIRAVDGNSKGYVFASIGTAQSDSSTTSYGGLVALYGEKTVRLWAPSASNGNIVDAGGSGWARTHAATQSSVADVRVLAWLPYEGPTAPDFDSGWVDMVAGVGGNAFKELEHGLGVLPGRVQTLVRANSGPNQGFIGEPVAMASGSSGGGDSCWTHVATLGGSAVLTSNAVGSPGDAQYKMSDAAINALWNGMSTHEMRLEFGSGQEMFMQLVYDNNNVRPFTYQSHTAKWRWTTDSPWMGPCGHSSQNTNYYYFFFKSDCNYGQTGCVCVPGNFENALYNTGLANRDFSNGRRFFPATGWSSNFKLYAKSCSGGPSHGILEAYNEDSVRLWAPVTQGSMALYAANGWGGSQNTLSVQAVSVRVLAWKRDPYVGRSLTSVAVNVNALAQAPLVVVPEDGIGTVRASMEPGTEIGVVELDGAREGALYSFQLVGGDDAGVFRVESATGAIIAEHPRNIKPSVQEYRLIIEVSDGLYSDVAVVRIPVGKANLPPVVAGATFEVEEGTPGGTTVGDPIVADDPDPNDTVLFDIVGGNTGDAFRISACGGELRVFNSEALDFEVTKRFELVVMAKDDGIPPQNSSATVIINLTNRNDAPECPSTLSASIPEDSELSADIGIDMAGEGKVLDPDNDTLTMEVIYGDDQRLFSFVNTSLRVVKEGIDFETRPDFALAVIATDPEGLSCQFSLFISVLDANDPPTMQNARLFVVENSPPGSRVGTVPIADQDDADSSYLSVEIIRGDAESFNIDDEGEITLAEGADMDYETQNVYELVVRATDTGGPDGEAAALSSEANVTVTVLDANDPPVVTATPPYTIAENSLAGTTVQGEPLTWSDVEGNAVSLTVLPIEVEVVDDDGDGGTTISYVSQPAPFEVDAEGRLVVVEGGVIDYESFENGMDIEVRAVDDGIPAGVATVGVTVTISDIEEAPEFDCAGGSVPVEVGSIDVCAVFSIPEDATVGDIAGHLDAVDPEGDDFEITITDRNPGVAFRVDSADNIVVHNAVLDYESHPTFLLQVTATELAGGRLSRAVTVGVLVTDVDEPPALESTISRSVEASAGANADAGLPIDAPDPEGGEVTFTLSGEDADLFEIADPASGQITTVGTLTAATYPTTFSVTVTARDPGGLESTATVIISLIDTNAAPRVTPQTFTLAEDADEGDLVGQIVAEDDEDGPFGLTFSIVQSSTSTGSSAFTVSETGQIFVANPALLDYESQSTLTFGVIVSDQGVNGADELATSAIMTVELIDVDEPPSCGAPELLVSEHAPVGSRAVVAELADGADGESDANLVVCTNADGEAATFELVGGNDDRLFELIQVGDGTSGSLGFYIQIAGEGLDYEFDDEPVHHLAVRASTGTATVTIAVDVTLEDENDAPIVPAQTLVVLENVTVGHLVGVLGVYDPDAGDSVSVSLVGEADADAFVLEPATLSLLVSDAGAAGLIDFERTRELSITVLAVDSASMEATGTITIVVVDVPDLRVSAVVTDPPAGPSTSGCDGCVTITGENMGRLDGEESVVSVSFGGIDAVACEVSTANTAITCGLPEGIGADLHPTVTVDGLTVYEESVSLSFARPSLDNSTVELDALSTAGGDSFSVSGENLGPAGTTVQLRYGSRSGGHVYSAPCVVSDAHFVADCVGVPGVGGNHSAWLTVGGQDSASVPAAVSYAHPEIDSVVGPVEIQTSGGETIDIRGANLGFFAEHGGLSSAASVAAMDAARRDGAGAGGLAPDGALLVTYGHSTGYEFVPLCAFETEHTHLRCVTEPGVGAGLLWRVSVSGTSSAHQSELSYAPPTIVDVAGEGAFNAKTSGGQRLVISGNQFPSVTLNMIDWVRYGPTASEYEAQECRVSIDFVEIVCLTDEGTGAGHSWQVSVGGQTALGPFAANTSYAPPLLSFFEGDGAAYANTEGGENIVIHGDNFGADISSLQQVVYVDPRLGIEYEADGCLMLEPHIKLSCFTLEGAGYDLEWTVVVSGLVSERPRTFYGAPVVETVEPGEGLLSLTDLATAGGDPIVLLGANFGPPSEPGPLLEGVWYGPSGREYRARECAVVSHSRIECTTAPGVGSGHVWRVRVAGQDSDSSVDRVSFRQPRITGSTPLSGPTRGGTVVEVVGTDLGIHDPDAVVAVSITGHVPPLFDAIFLIPPVPALVPPGHTIVEAGTTNGTHEFVQFSMPSGFGSGLGFAVTASNGHSRSHSDDVLWSYDPPTITAVNPRLDPDNPGGLLLEIIGINFCDGGSNCGTVTIWETDAPRGTPVREYIAAATAWTHTGVVVPVTHPYGLVQVSVGGVGEGVTAAAARTTEVEVFENLAPSLSSRVGEVLAGLRFGTAGGDIMTLEACYLNEVNTTVTVGSAVCELTGDGVVKMFELEDPTVCDPPNYRLTCAVPPGMGEDNAVVIWSNGKSSETVVTDLVLLKYRRPTIESVAIDSPEGPTVSSMVGSDMHLLLPTEPTVVVVTGADLGTAGYVEVGDGRAEVLEWSHDEARLRMPDGRGGTNVQLMLCQASGPDCSAFSTPSDAIASPNEIVVDYQPPRVTWMSSERGPTAGGMQLTLRGENFGRDIATLSVPTVWIGDQRSSRICAIDSADDVSHTELMCTLPEGEGTGLLVQIQVAGQGPPPDAEELTFSYLPPVVNAVWPRTAPTHGNIIVVVEGGNFGTGGTASLRPSEETSRSANSAPTPVLLLADGRNGTSWNHTHIVALLQPGRGDRMDVVVEAGRQTNSIGAVKFDYDPPAIHALSPPEAPTVGGTTLTIDGSSFGDGGVEVSIAQLGGPPQPCVITQRSHSQLQCNVPAGMGRDLDLIVRVDGRASTPFKFSYEKPVIFAFNPSTPDAEGQDVMVLGKNFGTRSSEVNITIHGVECAAAQWLNDNRLSCTLQRDVVGAKNVTVEVAGHSNTFEAWDLPGVLSSSERVLVFETTCYRNFYGRRDELCLPCPRGAICDGRDAEPISETGWWLSPQVTPNDLCPEERQGRVECPFFVPCEPKKACTGNNTCADGYRGERCSLCIEFTHYRLQGECVECPDNPWLIVIVFLCFAAFCCAGGYVLNKKAVNLAFLSIGVDYCQVLAMLARSKVQWPEGIKALFRLMSLFNLNIELAAPECAVPDFHYTTKWMLVQLLPVAAACLFLMLHFARVFEKRCIRGQRKNVHAHVHTMIAAGLVLFYYLYLVLTRTILDVFNCSPTDPPDGNEYLEVAFEACGLPGGIQMTLLPWAILALAGYTLAYPLGLGALLYRNRMIVKEDQLLRAMGLGDTKAENPHCYSFRVRYSKMYYHFKPDYYYWILAIIGRKFWIAFTSLMFAKTPSFQLAVALLVMFAAYAAQVRHRPYMSMAERDDVIAAHKAKVGLDPQADSLAESLMAAQRNMKKKARSVRGFAQVEKTRKNAAQAAAAFLFDYNTVEMVLLGCGVLVTLAGVMFSSERFESDSFTAQRDVITYIVLVIVIGSLLYFTVVFVSEVITTCAPHSRIYVMLSRRYREKKEKEMVVQKRLTRLNPMSPQARGGAPATAIEMTAAAGAGSSVAIQNNPLLSKQAGGAGGEASGASREALVKMVDMLQGQVAELQAQMRARSKQEYARGAGAPAAAMRRTTGPKRRREFRPRRTVGGSSKSGDDGPSAEATKDRGGAAGTAEPPAAASKPTRSKKT